MTPVKHAVSYWQLHTILALLVLDFADVDVEVHPFISYLRKTVQEIIEFEKDDTEERFIFDGYPNKNYLSYMKSTIRYLLSSAMQTSCLNLNSIKEIPDGCKYIICKNSVKNNEEKASIFNSDPVIIKRTFLN